MIELRPHQEKAVKELRNGNILCGDTGLGKTRVAIAYYLENEAPRPIFVITTAKVRSSLDWESTALRVGITPDAETTMGSVITVDSWNNIKKYEEVEGAFFVFDEQRVVGYGAWSKAFIKIARNNRWILLSATPGDVWLDYAPVFIANGFYQHISDFRDQHVEYVPRVAFPKVKCYHKEEKLKRLRNSILVDMPYERHTKRHEVVVDVDYDKELFRKVVKERWHVYENRPLTNVAELFSVMRKVVYSDETRLKAVRSLLQTHPKLIVFYNFDYELEILRSLSEPQTMSSSTCSSSATDAWDYLLSPDGLAENLKLAVEQTRLYTQPSTGTRSITSRSGSTGTSSTSISTTSEQSSEMDTPASNQMKPTVAEWNGHKHEPIPTTDSWVYLVQYKAGSEGWNCVETDAMCFYSPTYSYKDDHQAHGRIDRLNTPFAKLFYYRLISGSIIDKWVLASLRKKKAFNERSLAGTFGEF